MDRIIRQLFLFLIPTLVVALIFIPLSQDVFVSDDSDSNITAVKIDNPTKHLNYNTLLAGLALKEKETAPMLIVIALLSVSAVLLKQEDNLLNVKNHSPPLSAYI